MKKLLLIKGLFLLFTGFSQSPFITTWKTDNAGDSEDDQITLPSLSAPTAYNYDVDWGDGNIETGITTFTQQIHTYSSPGTYTVKITGDFPRFFFNGAGDKDKLLSIEAWGDVQWQALNFNGCINLHVNAIDAPDLSNVVDFGSLFKGCIKMNESINHWDVSTITSFQDMFSGATAYNQSMNSWQTGNVTNMSSMFYEATSFNQDLSNWDVSKVTTMRGMFMRTAMTFDLNTWDVSSVTDMRSMFRETSFNGDISAWVTTSLKDISAIFSNNSSFNQDISGWDVSKVELMQTAFYRASAFNQDLSTWDVSSATEMTYMFNRASSFNQDLSSWDVSSVNDMEDIFTSSALSTSNYDLMLNAWSQLDLQDDVVFDAGITNYCEGESARQSIIDNYNWTISDGGKSCPATGVRDYPDLVSSLYPNPANNALYVELPVNTSYTIQNLFGQTMITGELTTGTNTLNVSELEEGIYLLVPEGAKAHKFLKQ